jgi:hypothetical protein
MGLVTLHTACLADKVRDKTVLTMIFQQPSHCAPKCKTLWTSQGTMKIPSSGPPEDLLQVCSVVDILPDNVRTFLPKENSGPR